ncbi:lipopolysaccharide transport system ATP-binding protein [Polynucleobacter sphagniphilus]|uniref:ABC transporter ATP-binding protein n=1 Tax=Polynucleobacter sphagniphilus TaxID=1743169 RepID=UPI002474CACE|nr:ABC transporter ATP-binding protein [Polynucleobacter sphagniphilus]MDH6420915.1 lipopolysaccharide transport system ATP-binding protein [Polynucleobacter sphagniphilus]
MSYIQAKDLVVEFPLFNNTHRSIKNAVLHATTGGRLAKYAGKTTGVRALDCLNFDIQTGDRVGLVGHNGSGKTTLLRVLAGAYEPTFGALHLKGRVASLLDISLGMDQDASGYDNIFLRGVMMGLKPAEIRKKTEEIAEFTELGDFLNMPVRTYSSGMQLRLAFAVSTSVQADIIVMDEWLSVGDASFISKASERLKRLVDEAAILVIASHDPALIGKLCNRAFRMEHGCIVEEFSPQAQIVEQENLPEALGMVGH